MSEKVKLTYKDKEYEFPLLEGTEEEKGLILKPFVLKQV